MSRVENFSPEAREARKTAEQPTREHFRTVVAPALARDAAQDALDTEQERTGVHAECGREIADHCAYCDTCDCGCPVEDAIGVHPASEPEPMSAQSLLNAMIAYVVDSNPAHVADIMIHMVVVTRGIDHDQATEWLAEEIQERIIAQAD